MKYSEILNTVNLIIEVGDVPLIIGESGIGKTALVKDLARINGYETVTIDANLLKEGEIGGLPIVRDGKTVYATHYKLIELDKKASKNDGEALLFIDELNRCEHAVQQELMNLILNREINGYVLPHGVKVVAAMNPSNKYDNFENSEYQVVYISKGAYIRKLLTAENGRKAQIINFNINYIDDRLAKTITKIYSKMLFDYAKEMDNRGSLPFHIILEEAHRYVQNDNDIFLLGYNIFERITKEGRKYGVLMGFISQRPSELSETAISQCSNFLIFKMLHPKDVEYIREMLPNVTNEIIKRLRILQPGNCVAFGSAFKVPVLIKMDMPNPQPSSSSCDLIGTWFVEKK